MVELYIARHGETDFNSEGRYLGRTDVPLNSTGIEQAKELAKKVKHLNIGVLYSSPLKRAIETANIIASQQKQSCEVVIENNFIERSVGAYEGLTKEEAKNRYPDLYERNITRIFGEAPPCGETIDDVVKRVFSALDTIKEQNKFSTILVTTHGFVAKVINKYFHPEITEQEFFDFNLANAEIKKYILVQGVGL